MVPEFGGDASVGKGREEVGSLVSLSDRNFNLAKVPAVRRGLQGSSQYSLLERGLFFTRINGFDQRLRLPPIEITLIDRRKLPSRISLVCDSFAPVLNGLVFCRSSGPHSTLSFYDPVNFALQCSLNNNPIGMVKADGASELEVVDSKHRRRITLLCSAKARKAKHVRRFVQELCKPAFEVIVRGYIVEDCALASQRWKISAP